MSAVLGRIRSRLQLLGAILRCVSGPKDALAAIRVASTSRRSGVIAAPVPVRMKQLGDEPLYVRPGASDLVNAVSYYPLALHMPPPEVVDPRLIVELGTNSGVALTALAIAYPLAKLLGVEPDGGNVEVARKNAERFGDRCEVVQAAIWDETTELVVDEEVSAGQHGFVVRPAKPGDPASFTRMAGTTIDDIFASHLPGGETVDYMHMTIEGTEPRILAAGGAWTERVASLRIELHPYFDFTAAECIPLLEALGYTAREAPEPAGKWVFATKRIGETPAQG